jgi:hypothetical protein
MGDKGGDERRTRSEFIIHLPCSLKREAGTLMMK